MDMGGVVPLATALFTCMTTGRKTAAMHRCYTSNLHCKIGKDVLTQFHYISFLLLVCIVEYRGVPLPALDSTQIKNLIWPSRTLVDVMEEYFANKIVQSCGKKVRN